MIVVVIGVSGVGKSTIGAELARRLGCDFVDADDYHSAVNIKKLSEGHPLTDEDRQPWLQTLHRLLQSYDSQKKDVVLACSALKQSYRDTLDAGLNVNWVYLKSPASDIQNRLAHRKGHFSNPALLHSQLEILEEPTYAITINVKSDASHAVEHILAQLPQG